MAKRLDKEQHHRDPYRQVEAKEDQLGRIKRLIETSRYSTYKTRTHRGRYSPLYIMLSTINVEENLKKWLTNCKMQLIDFGWHRDFCYDINVSKKMFGKAIDLYHAAKENLRKIADKKKIFENKYCTLI